jgi:hypothetical protein
MNDSNSNRKTVRTLLKPLTASDIAAIMANDVEDFRATFKMTGELFNAMPPGDMRNELLRRNQKVRRAIEQLPRRVYERQPFTDRAVTGIVIAEELAVIVKLMDEMQAVFKSMDQISPPLQT